MLGANKEDEVINPELFKYEPIHPLNPRPQWSDTEHFTYKELLALEKEEFSMYIG